MKYTTQTIEQSNIYGTQTTEKIMPNSTTTFPGQGARYGPPAPCETNNPKQNSHQNKQKNIENNFMKSDKPKQTRKRNYTKKIMNDMFLMTV